METQVKDTACKVYQFVYPGKKRREDTFDKHCNEGITNLCPHGSVGLMIAFDSRAY